MKTIYLLLFLIVIPVFSQKLWEIEHNPNDVVRDVTEIPNSDLLLFTYNSGKLEIRNSNDGSLVRDVVRPQGEKGGYNISGLGNSYYFSERGDYEPDKEETYVNDTIFVFDLFTDEITNRITFDLEGYENKENIITKKIRYSFTPDMTKIFGKIEYTFTEKIEDYLYKFYFFVYDVNENRVIFSEEVDKFRLNYQGMATSSGFYLESYRSSPDSKYIILNGRDLGILHNDDQKFVVKIFSLEELKQVKEFYSDNEEFYYEYHSLINGKLESGFLSYLDPLLYIRFSFPELNRTNLNNLVTDLGIYPANNAKHFLCNNNLYFTTGEKIPGGGTQDYRFWLISANIDNNSIEKNYKNIFTTKSMYAIYLFDSCTKIIVGKDIDNRKGIIACYDFQTLNIEINENGIGYFSKTDYIINFNSLEFIGQTVNIEIYNNIGAKVGTFYSGVINQPNYNFNIPNLPSGAYYLQCQLPNQNLNFNFVVVR